MSLKTLTHSATRGVSRQVFAVKHNSPVLLVGVGLAGFVTTTVLACRATLKMSEVLTQAEEDLKKAQLHEEQEKALEQDDYDEKAGKKRTFGVKLKIAVKIGRLYAPAVAVGMISVAALTSSHVILTRRNTGLAAAYAIVDKGFKDYRARVIEDQGEEKDQEYRFGVTEKEIVDPDTGLVETARGIDVEAVKANEAESYARMFDKWNENWEPSAKQNLFYLQSVIRHFEDVLRLRGWVLLNDVYEHMGYEPTYAGSQVGWMRNGDGDGYISFGLERNTENAKKFLNGHISDVIIDFNVDGVIATKFKRM